jgi:aromatic-L-amino-acid decarboxylase
MCHDVGAFPDNEIQSFIMKSLEISPDEFRRLAEKVTQLTADYLRELDSRPISPSTTGEESERLFGMPLSEQGLGAESLSGLQNVIEHSRAQNSRFFGYVLGSGEPVAAVALTGLVTLRVVGN